MVDQLNSEPIYPDFALLTGAKLFEFEIESVLGYTSFDMLLLEADGFQSLAPRQLTAIGDWTAAGGSVVVAPRGKMAADHVEFLNRLAGRNSGNADSPAYSLTERGQLEIDERMSASGQKFARFHCGLGRAVIIHEPLVPEVDLVSSNWKAAVAFLWKIRDAQLDPILRNGVWDYPAQRPQPGDGPFRPYAPLRDELPRDIRQFLLPERIEGVPLWVVVIILSLYLATIAPGDYFLLGRLNRRKYTWAFFVAVSAAFTGCTVLIANRYMGHADYHTTLVFADLADHDALSAGDLDRKATLARVSRFEMLFSATQRRVNLPVRNALYVDITDRL